MLTRWKLEKRNADETVREKEKDYTQKPVIRVSFRNQKNQITQSKQLNLYNIAKIVVFSGMVSNMPFVLLLLFGAAN